MSRRVLHILSQRPGRTGSGITLAAFVQGAERRGWQQRVIVGTPSSDPHPTTAGIPADLVRPLLFETGSLDFPLPGMSDVMPYPSTVFSQMPPSQLAAYREAWRDHIQCNIEQFQPDIIHSHHVWIVSSLIKQVTPHIPVVTSCHATGLRQMKLCPHLADEVRRGCSLIDRFLVLHPGHAASLVDELMIDSSRVRVVGAGFEENVFNRQGRDPAADKSYTVVYAGKYSRAKGLPWLLDAIERLVPRYPEIRLHVAGTGAGPESDALRQRMSEMQPHVVLHGQLSQVELANLFQRSAVFVLPSFYEGLPLVVVEAMACGCRAVCTDLPGIQHLQTSTDAHQLRTIPLPRMKSVDQPLEEGLPDWVNRLTQAIDGALADQQFSRKLDVAKYGWSGVFDRVEAIWSEVLRRETTD